ncbi:MAG: peptidylprolyl isomerase [Chitinophagaceae bacterium]
MMRKILLALSMFVCSMQVDAQVLFSYGTHQVTAKEFMKAFEKNNTPSPDREKDIRDYLDLFIKFKLKVRGGYDLGLDTILSKQPEMKDFKNQIESPFLKDNEMLNKLAEEAYEHSLKDVRVSHIFVPFNSSFLDPSQGTAPVRTEDTLAAFKKITEAFNALQSGKDFKTVALKYSADPTVKKNNGDIGYITAFTVSYGIEKIVYSLPINGISNIFRSGSGYHIFQKTDE